MFSCRKFGPNCCTMLHQDSQHSQNPCETNDCTFASAWSKRQTMVGATGDHIFWEDGNNAITSYRFCIATIHSYVLWKWFCLCSFPCSHAMWAYVLASWSCVMVGYYTVQYCGSKQKCFVLSCWLLQNYVSKFSTMYPLFPATSPKTKYIMYPLIN